MGSRTALTAARRRVPRAALLAVTTLTVVATFATCSAALGAVGRDSSGTASGAITDPPIWNVQAFLPAITTYQRPGYSIPAPGCTKSGSAKSCATTQSITTTSADTTSATNSAPVASLASISCSAGAAGLVTCMALGSSPSGTPVLVATDDSGLDWKFGRLPSGTSAATSLSCPRAGVCYLAGEADNEPAVFSTHDTGLNWNRVPISGVAGFTGAKLVSISCPTETFCVASGGLVTNAKSGTFLAQTPLLLEMQSPATGFALPSYKEMGPFCCQGSNWGGFAEPGLPASVGSVSCGTQTSCLAIGGTDSGLGFIEGRSDDGGRHWVSVASHFVLPPGAHGLIGVSPPLVRCRSALSCQFGYAVDYGLGGATPYTMFRSDDGGIDWTYERIPSTVGNVSAFDCTGPGVCFAGGNAIASSNDGGAVWSESVSQGSVAAAGLSAVSEISCVPTGNCWAVGSGGAGAYILDTVTTQVSRSSQLSASRVPVCAGARLPEIGDPCRPAFAMSGLSVAPSCWTGRSGAIGAPAGGPQRLEGESATVAGNSATVAGNTALTGAWATLSVPAMCRDQAGTPASSSIVLQDLNGSAFFQVGVKYAAATPDDPNGSDELFTELQDGGAGSQPGSYGFAGSPGSASNPVPFTDVTWLQPLATTRVQVGLTETRSSAGDSEFSVDLYAPQMLAAGAAPAPAPSTFPFSGPAEFVFSCGAGGLGPGGLCSQGEKGSPGPLDTVDLVNEVGSSTASMPGSCVDPLTFSDVQVDRGGWVSFPQLPGIATSGTSYAFDRELGAWVLSAKDVSGFVPALNRAELYAQDGDGPGNGGGSESAGAWQVQNSSPSAQVTGVAMNDEPCETWAGVPAG